MTTLGTFITAAIYATFTDAEKAAVDRLSMQLGRAVTLEDAAELLDFEERVEVVETQNVSDMNKFSLMSHYVAQAGTITTVGGDPSENVSVPGLLASDLLFCSVKASSAGATIQYAEPDTDQIDFVFQTDPGSDTEVYYQVLRSF